VIAQIAIPPTESSFTRYFPQIPAETEVLYHVMVGPAVLTFVKELGEFYGSNRPQLFGFIDSLEAVDINSPGLEFLDGTHFWEGSPRYAQADDSDAQKAYRAAVGIDDNGASVDDPKDVSTAAHMFGCWETLYVIKQAMEAAGYKGPADRAEARRGDRGDDRVAEGPRASAGRQDLQRQDPPGLRHTEHLEGRGRQSWSVVHKTVIEDGPMRMRSITRRCPSDKQGWADCPPFTAGGQSAPPFQPLVSLLHGLWPLLAAGLMEGLVTAAVLALTALGLSLVFGVMRVVNVAHGEFFMLGAVLAWAVASQWFPARRPWLPAALLIAPLIVGASRAAAERLILKRLNYDPEATIVATIGLFYMIQQAALALYGPNANPVPRRSSCRMQLPWFGYSGYKLFVIVAAALMLWHFGWC
jgi:hypothetical protein